MRKKYENQNQGTGSAVPKLRVTNDDLSKLMDTSDEWIRKPYRNRCKTSCGGGDDDRACCRSSKGSVKRCGNDCGRT